MKVCQIHGWPSLAATLAVALAGCGGAASDNLPRQPIEGTVTLNGQALGEATIQFVPVDMRLGTPSIAEVKAGKFKSDRVTGPVPGAYRVVISSVPSAPPIADGEVPGPRPKRAPDLIPPQYNVKSTLLAEVKPDSPNSFDFPLVKKNGTTRR